MCKCLCLPVRDIIRQTPRNAISFHPALHPLKRYQFITLRDHLILAVHLGIFGYILVCYEQKSLDPETEIMHHAWCGGNFQSWGDVNP